MATSHKETKEPTYKIDYPKKIDAKDIQENGLLLSNADIKNVIDKLKTYPDKRFTKDELKSLGLNANYSIMKSDDKYFVVYKKSVYLGSGSEGRIKVAQYIGSNSELKADDKKLENVKDQKWTIGKLFALKVTYQYSAIQTNLEKEHKMLDLLGRAHSKIITREKRGYVKYQFLQELYLGEMLDIYLRSHEVSLKTALNIMYDTLKQIQFIHSKGILHCDIKLANVIYDPITGKIGIVDFGISLPMDKDQKAITSKSSGTVGYAAPELYHISVYDEKTEVYALGYFFSLIVDKIQRDEKSKHKQIIDDLTSKINEMLSNSKDFRPTLHDISHCLTTLTARITPLEVLSIDDKISIVKFLNILAPTNKGWNGAKLGSDRFERMLGESSEEMEIVYTAPTETKSSESREKLVQEMTDNAKKVGLSEEIIALLIKNINQDAPKSIKLDNFDLLILLRDAAKKYEDTLIKKVSLKP